MLIRFALFLSMVSASALASQEQWSQDQAEIIEINRYVPLALKEEGFTAYSELFHPDYVNWYMAGDKNSLLDRKAFLDGVRKWFEAGNYATYSAVVPISIEVMGDLAYVRHLQEEHFLGPGGKKSKFIGQFAGLMKKHQGKWTFYRTSFQERYRGDLGGSDMTLDNHEDKIDAPMAIDK